MARDPIVDDKKTFGPIPDDGYALRWPTKGIDIEVRYLNRSKHELLGELEVRCGWADKRIAFGCVFQGNFNLSSLQARDKVGRYLEQQAPIPAQNTKEVQWAFLLEEFCRRVVSADREGEAEIPFNRIIRRPHDGVTFDFFGVPLLLKHPTIWFGDGGSAKSYLALAVGLQLALGGKPVLYADWESDGDDHRGRLDDLCASAGLSIPDEFIYLPCASPLVYEAPKLRRIIEKRKIVYGIFDSIGYACQGPPETAEAATEYARTCRGFNIGSLHVAHISKAPVDEKTGKPKPIAPQHRRPFGSTFWHNNARATWFLQRADPDSGSPAIHVALHNSKSNTMRRHEPRGIALSFMPNRTSLASFDVADNAELSASLGIRERMKVLLKTGARSTAEIADELNCEESSVRTELSRDAKRVEKAEQAQKGSGRPLFARSSDDKIVLLQTH